MGQPLAEAGDRVEVEHAASAGEGFAAGGAETFTEDHAGTRAEAAAGAQERFVGAGGALAEQQGLDGAPALLLAVEAEGGDAGVVEDEEVAGAEDPEDVAEGAVLDLARVAVQVE